MTRMGSAGSDIDERPQRGLHRLSVEQYRAMARAGILRPEDRVELLEGLLVRKMTKNPPHRIATRRSRVALESVVPDGWYVDTQEPIVTADSEPEPDVCVVRGQTEDYSAGNPPAEAVALVVEIADASLLRDRLAKARIYARAGIPSYWVVNLRDRCVEVLSTPEPTAAPPRYRLSTVVAAGERVSLVLPGESSVEVAVSDLLPSASA